MPLVSSVLENQLYGIFTSMKDGDNTLFAQGIATSVVTFISSGLVSTTDVGAISMGAFVGSGTGSIVATPSACQSTIKSACEQMNNMTEGGNDYLAGEIGKGIKQMADDANVITTITGTVTLPNGVVSAMAGSGNGSIQCVDAPLVQQLKMAFKEMDSRKDEDGYDGDKILAQRMASAIDTFWKSGIVSTDGSANLAGSKGTGTVS